MKLSQPRITPLTADKWTDGQRETLEPRSREGYVHHVVGTLARHWGAAKKFQVWACHIIGGTSTLAPRERGLLILRVGWRCQAEYEWGQHVTFGREAGLTDEEIAWIKEGPDVDGWNPFDAGLLRAADELHTDAFIRDGTWAALSERHTTRQLMDGVFTVGHPMVSMALNSFGVQLDGGVAGC